MSKLYSKKSKDKIEFFLRPKTLDEYIGQEKIKNNLKIFIGATKKRKEVLDHILLYGPSGLGKTTLAYIIANEVKSKIHIINGPSIERPCDLASIFSQIEPGDILFIDEIHSLPKNVEEILYNAMEDFKLITTINDGDNSTSNIDILLPPFTLIGATTRIGNLSNPLKTRFGIVEKLEFYSIKEIQKIINRTSKILKTKIDNKASNIIASRSRGTPRIANRLFKRVRDFANFKNKNIITSDIADNALKNLKINELGLNDIDINYLKIIVEYFHGGPIGLKNIASAIGEETINLEDEYEPYLIKIGLINCTPKGRVATKKTYELLKSIKII